MPETIHELIVAEVCFSLAERHRCCCQRDWLLVVNIAEQTVSLFEKFRSIASWPLRYVLRKNFLVPLRVSASGRRKARIARRSDCIASRKKSARANRRERFSKARKIDRPHVAAGICGRQNHHAHFVAGRTRTRLQSRRRTWIRTRATFTSTARRTKNPSASRLRAAASIWPTRI